MEITIVFTGSPQGGSQSYPKQYSSLATEADRGPTDKEHLVEGWELTDAKQEFWYLYQRFDVKPAQLGRTGARFGIWLNLKGHYLAEWTDDVTAFFEKVFEKGLISEEIAGLLKQDPSDQLYYFTVKNLTDKSTDLDQIIRKIPETFLSEERGKLVVRPENPVPPLTRTLKYSPKKPTTPADTKVQQEMTKENPIANWILRQPEKKEGKVPSDIELLKRELKWLWVISWLALLMSLVTLTFSALSMNKFQVPIDYQNIQKKKENKPKAVHHNPKKKNESKELQPEEEPETVVEEDINTRSDIDLSECCILQAGATYVLSNYPLENDAKALKSKKGDNAQKIIKWILERLWEKYGLSEIEWAQKAKKEHILSTMININSGDLRKIEAAIKDSDNQAITYEKAVALILENGDFTLYIDRK